MPMHWRQVPPSKLLESEVEVGGFFEVLKRAKLTVSSEEITKYLGWTQQFNIEGS